MRVDFAAVRQISILWVLAHYHIEVRKRNNTEYVCDCPLKSHAQAKHQKGTFAISTSKGKWFCHADTCREAGNHPKGGDVIDLVCRMENLTALDAAKFLSELFGTGGGERRNGNLAAKPEPEATGNKPLAFELKGITPDHEFIHAKGITVETAKLYGVGFFPGAGSMKDRVVFALHEDGKLIGYAGRTVLPVSEANPKWKFPAGLVKSF